MNVDDTVALATLSTDVPLELPDARPPKPGMAGSPVARSSWARIVIIRRKLLLTAFTSMTFGLTGNSLSPTDNSAGLSRRQGTSRSPRSHRDPGVIIRARCRTCFSRGRWCSSNRAVRSICATSATGGFSCPGPIGGTRRGRTARSTALMTILWCTSPIGDAQAYAGWADKVIPTEAEWEYAARGGLEGAEFPWGDEPMSGGSYRANFWQGQFPWQNLASDGYEGTSPIGAFPPNGYGLFDMVGNTWEWTSDWYQPHQPVDMQKACSIPHNPRGGTKRDSFDPRQPKILIPRKVLKGGSHLCAQGYCYRYRPAARSPQPVDTATCHVGFRCIIRARD